MVVSTDLLIGGSNYVSMTIYTYADSSLIFEEKVVTNQKNSVLRFYSTLSTLHVGRYFGRKDKNTGTVEHCLFY